MYKEYMLKCECWNPLEGTWESSELFFDTEEGMRKYIKSQSKDNKKEEMFKLTKIEW